MSKCVAKYSSKAHVVFGEKVTLVKGKVILGRGAMEKLINIHNNLGRVGSDFYGTYASEPIDVEGRSKLDSLDTFDEKVGLSIAGYRAEVSGIKKIKKGVKEYRKAVQALLDCCDELDSNMDERLKDLEAKLNELTK